MDSIDLFHSICEEKFLKNACIILFLNKSDLFKQKVASVPINSVPAFADYDGPPGDYQAGVDYFAAKFKGRMSSKRLVSWISIFPIAKPNAFLKISFVSISVCF